MNEAGGVAGADRRDTQNLKQALGPELSAQTPMWGSNCELRDHDLS